MGKKDEVLEKALEMFNEGGYMDIGMREIARELKISPGNLTYHFKKKEDILIALLDRFGQQNSAFYEDYFASPSTLHNFLVLMKKIFESQYQFRGVYIGNQFVQAEIQHRDRFDYRSIATQREAAFTKIFEDLRTAEQIDATDDDIAFLVSFVKLIGRFWLSEATLFEKSPNRKKTIAHYHQLMARQLALFATEKGREGLISFRV